MNWPRPILFWAVTGWDRPVPFTTSRSLSIYILFVSTVYLSTQHYFPVHVLVSIGQPGDLIFNPSKKGLDNFLYRNFYFLVCFKRKKKPICDPHLNLTGVPEDTIFFTNLRGANMFFSNN